MDESVRILQQIEPRDPILVAAWPGMGNVAYGAAMYLKENLQASKFAEIMPENFFYRTGIQVVDGIVEIPGLPKSEFYFYKNSHGPRDLLLFIGESQPVMEKEYELALRIVELTAYYRVREIITFAATPVNITHHADPGVLCVSTHSETLNTMKQYGIKVMNAGHIGGLNGLLLGVGSESGIGGTCFLGEIPFYTAKIENPKSSLAVLRIFSKYTGIGFDFSSLLQMAKFVEEEIDRVSKSTSQAVFEEDSVSEAKEVQEEKKEGEQKGEKIPQDVLDRIEYMFQRAEGDLSKAGELKKELDRWGIFQEYEDRFLDLFGRKNL